MGETGADFKRGAQGKLAFFPPFCGLIGSVCMLPCSYVWSALSFNAEWLFLPVRQTGNILNTFVIVNYESTNKSLDFIRYILK